MRYHTNECVSCGFPCLYHGCPYYNVEHFECDFCHEEAKLYYYNGYEICGDCLLKEFTVVDGSDNYY